MLVFFAFAAMTSAACPTVAKSPSIYWAEKFNGKIQRAELDGQNVEDVLVRPDGPSSVAVDPATGKVYWIERHSIRRSQPNGSDMEDVVTGISDPRKLAIDSSSGRLYWLEAGPPAIRRANLDGSNVEHVVDFAPHTWPEDIDLATSNGKLYWSDGFRLQRAALDGADIEDVTVFGSHVRMDGLSIDAPGRHIYWVNKGYPKIQRVDFDGTLVEDVFTGSSFPADLSLDVANRQMYWVDYVARRLIRTTLEGTERVDLITSGLTEPLEVAVDPSNGRVFMRDHYSLVRADLSGNDLMEIHRFFGPEFPTALAIDTTNEHIYWTDTIGYFGPGLIRRSDLNGQNIVDLVTGDVSVWVLALDVAHNKVYWVNASTGIVARANLDGTEVESLSNITFPVGYIAVDSVAGKLYLAGGGIWRANLDGSSPEIVGDGFLDQRFQQVSSIALDLGAGKMYFVSSYFTGLHEVGIYRANLNGTEVEEIVSDLVNSPHGLALDPEAGQVYWSAQGFYEDSSIFRICDEGINLEYIESFAFSVITSVALDLRRTKPPGDGCTMDLRDFASFQRCFWPVPAAYGPVQYMDCATFDFNGDGQTIDLTEFNMFLDFLAGP